MGLRSVPCPAGTTCSDGACVTPGTPTASCGNGDIGPGEECDGTDFDGKTCASFSATGGTLKCTAACKIDTSSCYSIIPQPMCGDSKIEGNEQCDDGNTKSGDGCSSTCSLEITANCGNGIREKGEQCDGKDFGNTSCNDYGYAGGSLRCEPYCVISHDTCVSPGTRKYSNASWQCYDGTIDSYNDNNSNCQSAAEWRSLAERSCASKCEQINTFTRITDGTCGVKTFSLGAACLVQPCKDTDGGADWNVKGTIYEAGSIYDGRSDYCDTNPVNGRPIVVELICVSVNTPQAGQTWNYCPDGCYDGACINQTNTTTQPTCTETDRGKDEFLKGTTSIGNDSHTDGCYNNSVIEYYCSYDSQYGTPVIKKDQVTCSFGCSDGACLSKRPACTDSDIGKSYYVKGTASGYYSAANPFLILTDSCISQPSAGGSIVKSGKYLVESYCDNDVLKDDDFYTCPNECYDGACIDTVVPLLYEPVNTQQTTSNAQPTATADVLLPVITTVDVTQEGSARRYRIQPRAVDETGVSKITIAVDGTIRRICRALSYSSPGYRTDDCYIVSGFGPGDHNYVVTVADAAGNTVSRGGVFTSQSQLASKKKLLTGYYADNPLSVLEWLGRIW